MIIGTAFVDINAITDKLRGQIERAFDDLDFSQMGAQKGEEFGQGFSGAFKSQMADVFEGGGAAEAGERAGRDYGGGFNRGLADNLDLSDAVKLDPAIIREAVTAAFDGLNFSQLGAQKGDEFGQGFKDTFDAQLGTVFDRGVLASDQAGDAGEAAGGVYGREFNHGLRDNVNLENALQVDTADIQRQLTSAFSDLDLSQLGAQKGEDFAQGFRDTFNAQMAGAFDQGDLAPRQANDAGERAGNAFGRSFSRGVSDNVDLTNVLQLDTSAVQRQITDALTGINFSQLGTQKGEEFGQGFRNTLVAQMADTFAEGAFSSDQMGAAGERAAGDFGRGFTRAVGDNVNFADALQIDADVVQRQISEAFDGLDFSQLGARKGTEFGAGFRDTFAAQMADTFEQESLASSEAGRAGERAGGVYGRGFARGLGDNANIGDALQIDAEAVQRQITEAFDGIDFAQLGARKGDEFAQAFKGGLDAQLTEVFDRGALSSGQVGDAGAQAGDVYGKGFNRGLGAGVNLNDALQIDGSAAQQQIADAFEGLDLSELGERKGQEFAQGFQGGLNAQLADIFKQGVLGLGEAGDAGQDAGDVFGSSFNIGMLNSININDALQIDPDVIQQQLRDSFDGIDLSTVGSQKGDQFAQGFKGGFDARMTDLFNRNAMNRANVEQSGMTSGRLYGQGFNRAFRDNVNIRRAIRLDPTDIAAQLRQAFSRVNFGNLGKQAGRDFGDGFESTFIPRFTRTFDLLNGDMNRRGLLAGNAFGKAFDAEVRKHMTGIGSGIQFDQAFLAALTSSLSDAIRQGARDGMREATTQIDRDLSRLRGRTRGGIADVGIFNFLTEGADAAHAVFMKLYTVSHLLGPAMGLLGGAVASLASALVTLAAAASQAALSGVALLGTFAAVLQGGIAAKIGMTGVAAAFQAASKHFQDPKNKAALEAYNKALANLSPEARKFVKTAESMRSVFKDFRIEVQDKLFEGLNETIGMLKKYPTFLKTLKSAFGESASTIGDTVHNLAHLVMLGPGFEKLKTILDSSNVVLKNLGSAVVNVADILLTVLAAAAPLTQRFSKFIETATKNLRDFFNVKFKSGELTRIFNQAGDVMAVFGDIAKNVFLTLKNVFDVALGPGLRLLDWIKNMTASWKNFTESVEGRQKMFAWFETANENFKRLITLVGEFGKALLKPLADPAMGEAFLTLKKAAPDLEKIVTASVKLAPSWAEFVVQLARVGGILADNIDAAKLFINVVTDVVSVLAEFLGLVLGNPLGQFVVGIFAAVKGLELMKTVLTFFGRALFGSLLIQFAAFGTALRNLGIMLAGFPSLILGLGNAAQRTVSRLALLQGGLVALGGAARAAGASLLAALGGIPGVAFLAAFAAFEFLKSATRGAREEAEKYIPRLKELEAQGLSTADALSQTAQEMEHNLGFKDRLGAFFGRSDVSFWEGFRNMIFMNIPAIIDALTEGGKSEEGFRQILEDVNKTQGEFAGKTLESTKRIKDFNDMVAGGKASPMQLRDAAFAAVEAQSSLNQVTKDGQHQYDIAAVSMANLVTNIDEVAAAQKRLSDAVKAPEEALNRLQTAATQVVEGDVIKTWADETVTGMADFKTGLTEVVQGWKDAGLSVEDIATKLDELKKKKVFKTVVTDQLTGATKEVETKLTPDLIAAVQSVLTAVENNEFPSMGLAVNADPTVNVDEAALRAKLEAEFGPLKAGWENDPLLQWKISLVAPPPLPEDAVPTGQTLITPSVDPGSLTEVNRTLTTLEKTPRLILFHMETRGYHEVMRVLNTIDKDREIIFYMKIKLDKESKAILQQVSTSVPPGITTQGIPAPRAGARMPGAGPDAAEPLGGGDYRMMYSAALTGVTGMVAATSPQATTTASGSSATSRAQSTALSQSTVYSMPNATFNGVTDAEELQRQLRNKARLAALRGV